MKKVFLMPSLAIDDECIGKVGHISGLNFSSPDVRVFEPKSDFPKFNPASFAIEIEATVELPSPREDIWKTLIGDDRMDVIVKDERGCELHIPNALITQRVKITGRIPRRMKKHLKRIHGINWKQYHPNAENEVNINGK